MKLAFRVARLHHEVRVLGWWLFGIPVLVAGGLGALVGVLDARNVSRDFLANVLTATLEACLPLACGVIIATVVGQDAALELQLSAPTPYRRTTLRRIGLLCAWMALVEAATMLAIQATLPWPPPNKGWTTWSCGWRRCFGSPPPERCSRCCCAVGPPLARCSARSGSRSWPCTATSP
jgi:hypothetical protein